MMTTKEEMGTTLIDLTRKKGQEAPVKGGIDTGMIAPGKEEQEAGKDLEEDMVIMKKVVGGILAKRDERLAQRP